MLEEPVYKVKRGNVLRGPASCLRISYGKNTGCVVSCSGSVLALLSDLEQVTPPWASVFNCAE